MKPIVTWLASSNGRVISALLLFATVWAFERLPVVKSWLDGKPQAKRAVAVAMAILPAAAAGLWFGIPLEDVGQTALTAFLAATGLNTIIPSKPKPAPLAGAMVFVFLLTGCPTAAQLAASSKRVADCSAQYHACLDASKTREEYDACFAGVDVVCGVSEEGAGGSK